MQQPLISGSGSITRSNSESNSNSNTIARHSVVNLQAVNDENEQLTAYDTHMIFLRAIFAEFIISFIFLFVNMASAANLESEKNNIVLQNAITCGFIAACLVWGFADISGAHFNPAVTVAAYVSGRLSNRKAIFYIVAQLLGSILAALLLVAAFPANTIGTLVCQPAANATIGKAFLMEAILTFILVMIIFTTAFELIPAKSLQTKLQTHDAGLTLYNVSPQSKAGFAPLAIGFCIMCMACTGNSVSGAAYNPARAFGPAVVSGNFEHLWIYFVADFTGAVLAVGVRELYWYVFGNIKNA